MKQKFRHYLSAIAAFSVAAGIIAFWLALRQFERVSRTGRYR